MTAKSSTPISGERRRRRTKFSNDKLLSLVKRRKGKNQTNTQFRLVAEMGHGMLCPYKGKNEKSDAAGGVGEVEPDFYTAEVGAFGADGGGDVSAEGAGGANVGGGVGGGLAG